MAPAGERTNEKMFRHAVVSKVVWGMHPDGPGFTSVVSATQFIVTVTPLAVRPGNSCLASHRHNTPPLDVPAISFSAPTGEKNLFVSAPHCTPWDKKDDDPPLHRLLSHFVILSIIVCSVAQVAFIFIRKWFPCSESGFSSWPPSAEAELFDPTNGVESEVGQCAFIYLISFFDDLSSVFFFPVLYLFPIESRNSYDEYISLSQLTQT